MAGERLRVAIDLDQTTAAYVAAFRASVADSLGVPVESLDPDPDYHFAAWGVGDRFARLHEKAVAGDRIFRNMKMIEGASDAIRDLDLRGNALISVVTARLCVPGIHEVAIADTVAWLDAHNVPFHELIALRGRDLSKVDTVRFDALVDDKPEEIMAARAAGKIAIVFGDYAYNRHVPGPRATRWADVPDMILTMWEQQQTGELPRAV